MLVEFGLDATGVAAEDESDLGVTIEGNSGTRDDHSRSVVTAHGVERECAGPWHLT
jgi:hypothetical protein